MRPSSVMTTPLPTDPAAHAAQRRRNVGLAVAVVGAIAFSGKAVIVKLAYRHGVDPVTLIMLRMVMALPFFLAMAWWAGRQQPVKLSARDMLGVVGLGVSGYYLSSYLDFIGLQYVSASLERLILYLNPTLVALLGWLLHGRRIRLGHAVAMAVSYGGVLLVFGHELAIPGARAGFGAMLVLVSAIIYALYLVYSAQLVQRLGSLRLVGLATTVACLCCMAQFAVLRPLDSVWQIPTPVLWLSLINGMACTAVPVLLVMMAVERIGAAAAAQLGMVGPISTIALSTLLLGESFTGAVAAGTVLVLAGVYLFTRVK